MGREPNAQSTGVVRSIAYRPADGDPMQEIDECRVVANRGLDIETRKSDRRNITILSKESWDDACRELGQDIP